MGELFTNDANGTYFTRSIEKTNRITKGLVDFEKIAGTDGIFMANIIQNADEAKKSYKTSSPRSFNGKDWEDFGLGMDIRAKILTTTPDSTSLEFILVGEIKDHKTHIFALDFEDIFDGKRCNLDKDHEDKSDYEKWYARLDNDGKPDCLMGPKQFI